jgi:hypothetical protein
MNNALRKLALIIGIGVLIVSMYWSQDGFNFDVAGNSGYKTMALIIGWFLAIAVTVIEFVFSSNFRDLNPSLILFGLLAYAYSIYTNYEGILHFQGTSQSAWGAGVLGFFMDAVPEPLIGWALYESRGGDFVGNILKTLGSITRAAMSAPNSIQEQNKNRNNGGFEKYKGNLNISEEMLEKLRKSLLNTRFSDNFQNLHRINQKRPSRYNVKGE